MPSWFNSISEALRVFPSKSGTNTFLFRCVILSLISLPDFTSFPAAGYCSSTIFGLISLVKIVSAITISTPSDLVIDFASLISKPPRLGVKTVFFSLI